MRLCVVRHRFAATSAIESAYLIAQGTTSSATRVDLSEQQLVSCVNNANNYYRYGYKAVEPPIAACQTLLKPTCICTGHGALVESSTCAASEYKSLLGCSVPHAEVAASRTAGCVCVRLSAALVARAAHQMRPFAMCSKSTRQQKAVTRTQARQVGTMLLYSTVLSIQAL